MQTERIRLVLQTGTILAFLAVWRHINDLSILIRPSRDSVLSDPDEDYIIRVWKYCEIELIALSSWCPDPAHMAYDTSNSDIRPIRSIQWSVNKTRIAADSRDRVSISSITIPLRSIQIRNLILIVENMWKFCDRLNALVESYTSIFCTDTCWQRDIEDDCARDYIRRGLRRRDGRRHSRDVSWHACHRCARGYETGV